MPKRKVQFQEKADEDSLSESIIAKSYRDFTSLVTKSYFPRFTEPSKAIETPVSQEETISPKLSEESQA